MVLVLIGVALGLAGAVALTRVMSSLLFGVGEGPVTFVGGDAFAIGFVGALHVPARRAQRVDPLVALRRMKGILILDPILDFAFRVSSWCGFVIDWLGADQNSSTIHETTQLRSKNQRENSKIQ